MTARARAFAPILILAALACAAAPPAAAQERYPATVSHVVDGDTLDAQVSDGPVGPVYVSGDDPYGLDGDGDGVACES